MKSKLRQTDEAVFALFKDLIVVSEDGNSHNVPAIWGTEEKQKTCFSSEGDNIDRIKLPSISVSSGNISMWGSDPIVDYTAVIHSFYQEDINQIIEQIVSKFDNKKNCKLSSILRNDNDHKEYKSKVKVIRAVVMLTVEGIGVPVETHE